VDPVGRKHLQEKGPNASPIQYSAFEVLPGVKAQWQDDARENIADVGGMKLAFRAYRSMRASSPAEQIATVSPKISSSSWRPPALVRQVP